MKSNRNMHVVAAVIDCSASASPINVLASQIEVPAIVESLQVMDSLCEMPPHTRRECEELRYLLSQPHLVVSPSFPILIRAVSDLLLAFSAAYAAAFPVNVILN
jgi:hypothetical protein